MNTYQIEITNMVDDTDMNKVQTALYDAGVRGEDRDDIGMYLQETGARGYFVFVEPSDVTKAVKVINALGFETDEDEQDEE